MPKDHFVPQTYLDQFCDPMVPGRLHAYRKSSGGYFTPRPRDVCRVPDGSTTDYLTEPRRLEERLRRFERLWNPSVENFAQREVDGRSFWVLLSLIVSIDVSSPTALRNHATILEKMVDAQARALDDAGALPPIPPSLNAASVSELFDRGTLEINVDHKYPLAVGVSKFDDLVRKNWRGFWTFLINNDRENPFITSDFPPVFDRMEPGVGSERLLPITPMLLAKGYLPVDWPEDQPPKFRFKAASRDEIVRANRQIAQCAEDLVFFPAWFEWSQRFVNRNADFHLDCVIDEIDSKAGRYFAMRRVPMRRAREPSGSTP